MKKIFLFTVFIILCYGCSLYQIESESMTYGGLKSAKKSKGEVLYLETVTQPHAVIGQIKINAERNQSFEEVIDKLKTEAAVLGADAITNIQTNAGTGTWARIKPKKLFGNANIRINYIVDVVVFGKETVSASDISPSTAGIQEENLK